MIKNIQTFRDFENNIKSKEGVTPFKKAIKIFTSLWIEAQNLGIFPLKDPLEGIEIDIKIAKILNKCSKNYYQK